MLFPNTRRRSSRKSSSTQKRNLNMNVTCSKWKTSARHTETKSNPRTKRTWNWSKFARSWTESWWNQEKTAKLFALRLRISLIKFANLRGKKYRPMRVHSEFCFQRGTAFKIAWGSLKLTEWWLNQMKTKGKAYESDQTLKTKMDREW